MILLVGQSLLLWAWDKDRSFSARNQEFISFGLTIVMRCFGDVDLDIAKFSRNDRPTRYDLCWFTFLMNSCFSGVEEIKLVDVLMCTYTYVFTMICRYSLVKFLLLDFMISGVPETDQFMCFLASDYDCCKCLWIDWDVDCAVLDVLGIILCWFTSSSVVSIWVVELWGWN